MKKVRIPVIIIAVALLILLAVFLVRTGTGKTRITKDITITNGQIVQWYIPSSKETRAHVKIKVVDGTLKDYTGGSILIKGKANATGKTITAEDINNKKSLAFSLPFYEGDGNYIQLVGNGIGTVQLEIEVETYTWKMILEEGSFEYGKDYGVK